MTEPNAVDSVPNRLAASKAESGDLNRLTSGQLPVIDAANQDETPDLTRLDALEVMVDEWGQDSFPASDPPGSLPPSLMSPNPVPHSSRDDDDTRSD